MAPLLARLPIRAILPVFLLIGCDGGGPPNSSTVVGATSQSSPVLFVDVAAASGLDYRHDAGLGGDFFLPEIMGPGAALLDYDGDGDLDVLLLQGGPFTLAPEEVVASSGLGHRLFRNELIPGGSLAFSDVSATAGPAFSGHGMGIAVADYDNDNDPDLFVTGFAGSWLYRNDAGKFVDVSKEAGFTDTRWATSAAFVDYDRDGDHDLFVAYYVNASLANRRRCIGVAGQSDYCTPGRYQPLHDRLYRNDGDGRFIDVTESVGLMAAFGPGLGVVGADFNADGWQDLYVANDGAANQLWINVNGQRFVDRGLMSGTAYNGEGAAEASMGVAVGDVDGDGDDDLFMTHFSSETNTLYANSGGGQFYDATVQMRLARESFAYTGFGVDWLDYDLDGRLDLFIANGAAIAEEKQVGHSPHPYAQRNQLFRNLGGRGFEETSLTAGPALALEEVSRAAAFGDIDNDGDTDILLSNNHGPVRLLRNDAANGRSWLSLRLHGQISPRDGAGARAAVLRADRPALWRRAHTDGSYLSASDGRVYFGLDNDESEQTVRVDWPSGRSEQWSELPVRRIHELVEGGGTALP